MAAFSQLIKNSFFPSFSSLFWLFLSTRLTLILKIWRR